jgi:lactoylglutathione lyase
MAIIPLKGLFETHLTVSNLDASIAFYRDVIGLHPAHRVPDRHAAFFWIGAPGKSILGLWSIHSTPVNMRLHLAFDATLDNVVASITRLRAAGITPRHGIDRTPITEPVVISWMPAASVYFDDPDGHSLEYIAMLDGPSRPEWGWLPLSEWQRRTA